MYVSRAFATLKTPSAVPRLHDEGQSSMSPKQVGVILDLRWTT
ncbi:MAG: hypothetical protein QXZ62_00460 [Candidatus Caldarchaeum sp.]